MSFWPPTGALSYRFTGESWTDEDGTVWYCIDRSCGACDEPIWVFGKGARSGHCANGHRCFLTDEWTM